MIQLKRRLQYTIDDSLLIFKFFSEMPLKIIFVVTCVSVELAICLFATIILIFCFVFTLCNMANHNYFVYLLICFPMKVVFHKNCELLRFINFINIILSKIIIRIYSVIVSKFIFRTGS